MAGRTIRQGGRLLAALVVASLFVACGGQESSSGPAPLASIAATASAACAPNEKCSAPTRPASPDALAVKVVGDFYAGPAAPGFVDASGLLLNRVGVMVEASATVAQVDAALAAVGGRIAISSPGSALLTIDVPPQPDTGALFALIRTLERQPGVLAAFPDSRGVDLVLPAAAPGGPSVAPGDLTHLLPTRFPAAWNAAGLLDGCAAKPRVRIIVVDRFARDDPEHFLSQIPLGAWVIDNAPARQLTSAEQLRDHGYLVTLAMAARHDGVIPTGAHPRPECLRIDQFERGPLAMSDLAVELGREVAGVDENLIVLASNGFGLPPCGPPASPGVCDPGLAEETALRVEGRLRAALSTTIAWAERGVTTRSNRHALFVTAAGNDRQEQLARAYRGLADARHTHVFQGVQHLGALGERYGSSGAGSRESWSPVGDDLLPHPFLRPVFLSDRLRDGFQREVDRLGKAGMLGASNVLTVGALREPATIGEGTGADPLPAAAFSHTSASAHAVGQGVRLEPGGPNRQGTSFAAPQVAGLAAYLWLLSDELRAQPVEATARLIRATSRGSLGAIDAYAAVLALDRPGQLKRVRRAILDANGDGVFDDADVERYLLAFAARDALGGERPLDFSRFDLNGDGRTGGPGAFRMDLDAEAYADGTGAPILARRTASVEGRSVQFDEASVTDQQVLCYFAYDTVTALYSGSAQRRRELLGERRCGAPVALSTVFPQRFTGDANLDVLAATPSGGQPIPNLPIRFTASCGTVEPAVALTGADGRVNVKVTPTAACASVSIAVEAFTEGDERVLATAVANATIGAPVPNVHVEYTGSITCNAFDIRLSFSSRNYSCTLPNVTLGASTSGPFGQRCTFCLSFQFSSNRCGLLTIVFPPAEWTSLDPGGRTFAGTRQIGSVLETISGQIAYTTPLSLSAVTEFEFRNSRGELQSSYRCTFDGRSR